MKRPPKRVGLPAKGVGVVGDQRGRPAAVAEAELLDRTQHGREHVRRNIERRVPIRLRAVLFVAREVLNPFGVIHNSLPGSFHQPKLNAASGGAIIGSLPFG